MTSVFVLRYLKTILAIFLLLITLFLLFNFRKYIYLAYQNIGYRIGVNLNNISTGNYVSWINTQNTTNQPGQAVYLGEKIEAPNFNISNSLTKGQTEKVLGVDDNKWIEVDISEQRLYMKEGGQTAASFLVSTGKWAPTPKGEWRIWTKLRYTRMQGGSKALGTYYDLPNVPYTMYYYQGYGIHGAYWHNNFGNPMSHGCVNMKPEEAGIVFNWAQVGTRVIVHE